MLPLLAPIQENKTTRTIKTSEYKSTAIASLPRINILWARGVLKIIGSAFVGKFYCCRKPVQFLWCVVLICKSSFQFILIKFLFCFYAYSAKMFFPFSWELPCGLESSIRLAGCFSQLFFEFPNFYLLDLFYWN